MDLLLVQIYKIISLALTAYSFALVIYILMSWVPASRDTAFGRILEKIAEPYLGFFRRFIPPLGMIDISPIVGLLALRLIERGLRSIFIWLLTVL
ncbi:putative membrane protein YlmG [Sporosarcina sp. NCCP-2716]|uniref:YggT family protein n=1 Tax=Sporosarcina sp. NCCP-2716 TaxID=2943679 RepID=UPI00203CA694|nr:YggT family protein [Sporosarcina sp. NCCP-2716]GKV67729.1 putative membrane protein YlmG [Sporosarcina sp. NCCP-2716]